MAANLNQKRLFLLISQKIQNCSEYVNDAIRAISLLRISGKGLAKAWLPGLCARCYTSIVKPALLNQRFEQIRPEHFFMDTGGSNT